MDINKAIEESAAQLGFPSIKEEQFQCIKAFLLGRDVFAILLTGFGKIACFTCLPSALDLALNGIQVNF